MHEGHPLQTLGLPPIDQIGFVVRSLADAERRYGALFGPFTRMDGSVQGADYRGRVADVELALLFGRSGALEMEFIEWRSGESPHREFLERGREGMHHVRFRVDAADAWIERVAAAGYEPIWYKRWSDEITFAYLERANDPLVIELLQMPAMPSG